jgi:glycosyltransferase involved in cell wall biosynthesis
VSSDRQIAVVAATYRRPLRLRWLLNALEDQTLPRGSFEVLVAHDPADRETIEVLARHPLGEDGTLRPVAAEPSEHRPARLRNLAWRVAEAPLVAFTDDDCRPAEDWLERLIDAGERMPDAIFQGTTLMDPAEHAEQLAPWPHSQHIEPPEPWAQTCNMLYPRALLARVGGFDESYPGPAGEDTDLAMRVQRAGAAFEAVPEAVTYHAVHSASLASRIRSTWRWHAVPAVPKRYPEIRRHYALGLFWRREHMWLALAGAGLVLARRSTPAVLLALPWCVASARPYGPSLRGRVRSALELPGRLAIDTAEVAALAWGSAKHRTLLL